MSSISFQHSRLVTWYTCSGVEIKQQKPTSNKTDDSLGLFYSARDAILKTSLIEHGGVLIVGMSDDLEKNNNNSNNSTNYSGESAV